MPVMLPWYASCALLAKTSLLGLGAVTIGLAVVALVALRFFARTLDFSTRRQLNRLFKTALWLHLAAYGLLLGKLCLALLGDTSWRDIPSFVVSHLVMHHLLSGLSATVLIVMTIRLYNQRHALQLAKTR
ncbi:MAG TPA: hypothetical protein DCS87_13325 [Rheinheimera sp.]|nr:hypothetical protein [Rheinheimera sp.]